MGFSQISPARVNKSHIFFLYEEVLVFKENKYYNYAGFHLQQK